MQITKVRYLKLWQLYISLLMIVLKSSQGSQAIQELDLLEEFGIEVFETDPARQAELKAQQEKEAEAALPPHISPETLAIDEALDAVDLEKPEAPTWEPIEHEISLTAVESQECCLRAIRSTRYEAEAQCRALGWHVWHIESAPIAPNSEEPIKQHKLCQVYYNKASKDGLTKDTSDNLDEAESLPDYYRCRARSRAKCFAPTEENASFIAQ